MAPTSGMPKRRRGRPRKSDSTPVAKSNSKQAAKQHLSVPRRPRKNSSQDEPQSVLASRATRRGSKPSKGSKRNILEEEADELGETTVDTTTINRHTYLAPKTKRIRHEVVQGWPEISQPVLEQIKSLLRRARDEIVYTRRDERRGDQARDVLNATIRQLERHLSTMKAPPHTKSLHLNLDRLVDSNVHVYGQVTATRHSNQLLEEHIEAATTKLEGERARVTRLEKNAQQWNAQWKSQEKKQLHPLLQQADDVDRIDDKPEEIGWRESAPVDISMLDDPEPELAPLVEQLRRSLETMQGNHAQVEGVGESMQDAQAALNDLLFRHASAQQYDAL